MKKLIVLPLFLVLFGCASLPQHWGEFSDNTKSKYDSGVSKLDESLAEIICASGKMNLSLSKPMLKLTFDDTKGLDLFKKSYTSVKLKPATRDFTLRWSYKNQYAEFKAKNFEFKANTKYFANYSVRKGVVKVWIEHEDGTVVYGKKPEEGQF